MADIRFELLPDPGDRYQLGDRIGRGVYSEVFEAVDTQAGGKRVAVKIQPVSEDILQDIREEFRVLRDLSTHPNLPDFYGVYMKRATNRVDPDKLWFVMELCDGGPVTDLVQGLHKQNRKMNEDHIAYILKESVKALSHLHEHNVMHRDVKGSNILLTKEGEVKLVDFGLAKELESPTGRRNSCLGSPCWMAPELISSCSGVAASEAGEEGGYDNRVDVWAIGITAIELGDGKPPFQDMHPTRTLFQIMRNPPPMLYRPANWSKLYNDFITECLEKNPENRPYMAEILEHPFLTALPENDFHLTQELKKMLSELHLTEGRRGEPERRREVAVRGGALVAEGATDPEPMRVEDLAALEPVHEDAVLAELHERMRRGHCYTFVGDVLLLLNPNEQQNIYGPEVHTKYQFKSRSDNAPHIFAVADRAYQDAMHHEEPQTILLAGETASGKTTSLSHLVHHLAFLGKSGNGQGERVEKALSVLRAFGNAATPLNGNSTRHVFQVQLTFGLTGKLSGAIFWIYQLEKWRVSTKYRQQANFHVFYYWYDGSAAEGKLKQHGLNDGRQYRYLRAAPSSEADPATPVAPPQLAGPREDASGNVRRFKELRAALRDLGVDADQEATLWRTLAAILQLGEVRFQDDGHGQADLRDHDLAANVAKMLGVDEKKFAWALTNYCVIQQGTAVRRRHTVDEAEEARDVLARGIYSRLVDWLVNLINFKMSFSRAVFGDHYCVNILDMFGFECFKTNSLEQLFVNTLNEQMQYHYNQRVFAWEMQEAADEDIQLASLQFYDNKPTVDALMAKPSGLLYILDDASRNPQGSDFIAETLRGSSKGPHLRATGPFEFSVAHYTGKVTYNATDMAEKNRDFLPPEMIETLRQSTDPVIRQLFTNQLSRPGNLTFTPEEQEAATTPSTEKKKSKWGRALVAENTRMRRFNTESRGQYSQTRRMRTAAAVFRAVSLELLKNLSVGAGSGGTHFVRCLRADLTGAPRGFQPEVVRQQLRALSVVDTARARQSGYPHRITFAEFIRRYKFLAFDFDENVEVTKDNSRLLLVRLKMEGWKIGRTKVFLKYYNEEYLARSYEIQVKKIIKVQTMMRAFLAKRNVAGKLKKFRQDSEDNLDSGKKKHKKQKGSKKDAKKGGKDKTESDKEAAMSQEEAAVVIQKQFRGYQVRKQMGQKEKSKAADKLQEETALFIRQYCRKWKAKSMFQVLLLYRAAKHQDLVYFSQQVHLYNQNAMSTIANTALSVQLNHIDPGSRATIELGKPQPTVWKLPFRLADRNFFDTSFMCDPAAPMREDLFDDDQESWDEPLRRDFLMYGKKHVRDVQVQTCSSPFNEQHDYGNEANSLSQTPFCRDPDELLKPSEILQQRRYGQPFRGASPVNSEVGGYKSGISKVNEKPNRGIMFDQPRPYQKTITTPKRFAPKPPSPTFSQSSYNDNEAPSYDAENNILSSQSWNQTSSSPTNERFGHTTGVRRSNPIAEMEMRGRRQSNAEDTDEPPFNFQAMLRKTNYKRASLKRDAASYGHSQVCNEQNANFSSPRRNNVVFNSSPHDLNRNRSPSPTASFGSETPGLQSPYQRKKSPETNFSNRNETSPDTMTELAPGIVIQGQVADL
ncbi:neither inactivation nor afterpotential protein C isoform X1 [Schistocerca serialis cubense]|uniref:neither inactivation nor afterpotential protein C isoform X1 n=1 Tax=Schistocerca serialis cubense TaxID=2023355 RepID=UPI00214F0E8D|nr:neither inactivation nor afterpotential protein C isoform X1 [Schistocerca serialis cubense]